MTMNILIWPFYGTLQKHNGMQGPEYKSIVYCYKSFVLYGSLVVCPIYQKCIEGVFQVQSSQ